MLTRAAADFPNGDWLSKNGADNVQNGIFIIFTGLRKRFIGHLFDGLMLFCCGICKFLKILDSKSTYVSYLLIQFDKWFLKLIEC